MSDVIKQWRESAQYWAKHNATIRTMFAPLTDALIAHAEIREGQSILDVAGGPGEPSLTIAQTVGPTGSVTCTDVVAEMVETARAEAERRDITNVRFQQCSAGDLPFPDNSFDAAVSRLGVMLFPDPLAAIREMLRVTKPGGHVAFVVWHKSELNPFCYAVSNVIDQHVKSQPEDPDAPGAFRFAEPGKLANVMKEAGAVEVKDEILQFEIAAPVSPEEFWGMRSKMSDTLRDKLNQLPEDEQAQVAGEIKQAVQQFFPQNQMKFPAKMIVASGRKA